MAGPRRERVGHARLLHALGTRPLTHVSDQFVLGLRAHHGRVEAEGVVEVEAERMHDGLGQITKRLAALDPQFSTCCSPSDSVLLRRDTERQKCVATALGKR